MDTEADPRTWVPPVDDKDCSQGFCSEHCPQWCYIVFAPPPPAMLPSGNPPNSSLSPLKISIIGILATALLLVSYYTISSKFCGSSDTDPSRRRRTSPRDRSVEQNENSEENHDVDPWQAPNTGLDESLIKLITVCRYRHGDGVVEGTDCSICLGEFREDESLRLLPKCSHAFHVTCIDKWLRSHSNCPLCRTNIMFVVPSPPLNHLRINHDLPLISQTQPSTATQDAGRDSSAEREARTEGQVPEETPSGHNESNSPLPKSPLRGPGNTEGDTVIEIGEVRSNCSSRRSASTDRLHVPRRMLVSDVLRMNQDEEECRTSSGESSSGENYRKRVLEYRVMSPGFMRRSFSFSGGRLLLGRQGRA